MSGKILSGHGSGGKATHKLIKDLFYKYFDNEILLRQTDAAVLDLANNKISFTTDSFVVNPVVFPGGDIGKLAVCGTVNDIAVSGAKPLYLSAGFIIEEGLEISLLERIVKSMAEESKKAGITIVAGDTKVVGNGECDKIFINTSGIGVYDENCYNLSNTHDIKIGDHVLLNGYIGDHGIALLKEREALEFREEVISDCNCLNGLIYDSMKISKNIRFCRDATRGGIATVLCEIVDGNNFGIKIDEDKIPVRQGVTGITEIFGYDPLYLANEGKIIMIANRNDSKKIIECWKSNKLGIDSAIIGEITESNIGKVIMETIVGGKRIVEMLTGDQLPRIC